MSFVHHIKSIHCTYYPLTGSVRRLYFGLNSADPCLDIGGVDLGVGVSDADADDSSADDDLIKRFICSCCLLSFSCNFFCESYYTVMKQS